MKHFPSIALGLLLGSGAVAGQELEPADFLQSVDEWIHENIDESALEALGVDAARVQEFLAELQKTFAGNYVFDLAASGETARQLLPVLQKFDESRPYAAWLQAHLDYFDVSEKLRKEVAVAPAPARPPNPAPERQRSVWAKEVEKRPWPPLASRHVARLKEIFIEEKMPPELVWLAEVESSFDVNARSPAGAVGLFQLMPVTARTVDLSVGMLRDDRLHPEKNARGAAKYLRRLYARFGDWRLTFAAYNAGETRVSDLLKKHRARTFEAIAAYLPAETQMFVPKVEATIRKREGRSLHELRPG